MGGWGECGKGLKGGGVEAVESLYTFIINQVIFM